jgi:hypothetical protein
VRTGVERVTTRGQEVAAETTTKAKKAAAAVAE